MLICAVWISQITYASAYFIVEAPQFNTSWVNNASNLVSWVKGVDDGIFGFDLEMTRMSEDGLFLIAKNVLASPGAINVFLIDVPPADDYFLLFINSTIGLMVGTSSQFSILAPSTTPSVSPPSPAGGVPTVTVSGAPNLTQPLFATTFATLPGGAVALFSVMQVNGLLITLLGCAFGASLTLGW